MFGWFLGPFWFLGTIDWGWRYILCMRVHILHGNMWIDSYPDQSLHLVVMLENRSALNRDTLCILFAYRRNATGHGYMKLPGAVYALHFILLNCRCGPGYSTLQLATLVHSKPQIILSNGVITNVNALFSVDRCIQSWSSLHLLGE